MSFLSETPDIKSNDPPAMGGSKPCRRRHRLQTLLLASIFIATCGVIVATAKNYYLFLIMPEGKRLSLFWERDYKMLQEKNLLPPEAQNLKSFSIITTSELTQIWKKNLQIPFTTKKNGKYKMEVLLMGLEEPELRGAVIQMNIATIKDDNHVWELGRTYSLKLTPIEIWIRQNISELLPNTLKLPLKSKK